jgi:hypothetical protein
MAETLCPASLICEICEICGFNLEGDRALLGITKQSRLVFAISLFDLLQIQMPL